MSDFAQYKAWTWKTWEEHHGIQCPWASPEFRQLHTLYKRVGDERARQLWNVYLQNVEPYFNGKDPKKLLNQISRFTADVVRVYGRLPDVEPQSPPDEASDEIKQWRINARERHVAARKAAGNWYYRVDPE